MTFEQNRGQEKLKKCPACNREFVGTMVVCPQDNTLLIPVKKDVLIGTKVADKYEVLSEVGHGGMSIVYKARHELMDRIVAIKMLQAALVNDQTSIKRFQQEAQAAAASPIPMSSPCTITDWRPPASRTWSWTSCRVKASPM